MANPTRSSRPRAGAKAFAIFEHLLLWGGLFAVFFLIPHELFADGQARFDALDLLLDHGRVVNGPYSLVGPLFSAPLWLLGKAVESPHWWCARYNVFVLGAGLVAAYRLLRPRFDGALVRRFLLLLLLASMFPNHLRAYYGEVFTVVLLAVGILAVTCERPRLGWTLVIIGVVNTPASLVGLGLVCLVLGVRERRFRYALPVIIALLLILAEAWIRRGSPFVTGYEGNHGAATLLPYSGRPGFSYPFFFGVLSLLFSFGKGVFFFAPGLLLFPRRPLLGAGRQLATAHRLWIWVLVGLIGVYASWWAWYGGWFWGPRFLLIASVPASLAMAVLLVRPGSALRAAFTLVVLGWSFWVGASGAVFDSETLDLCARYGYRYEVLCWYVPEFSVLWRPFVKHQPLTAASLGYLALSATAFLYLAAPLVRRIGGEVGKRLRPWVRENLNPRRWRF